MKKINVMRLEIDINKEENKVKSAYIRLNKDMPKITDDAYREILNMSVQEFYDFCVLYKTENKNVINELILRVLINTGQIEANGNILNKGLLSVREMEYVRIDKNS